MNKNIEINIRYELIKALGTNDLLQEEITSIYEKNKPEYYKLYRESGFYRDMGFEVYPIRYYRSLQMVSGIVEKCYAENNFIPLNRIIKKGYNKLYRYITQTSMVHFNKVMSIILNERKLEDLTEEEILHNYVIVIYISTRENKPCQGVDVMMDFIHKQLNITIDSLRAYHLEKELEKENELDEFYSPEDIEKINKTSDDILFGKKMMSFNNLLDIYIEKNLKKLFKQNGFDYDNNEDDTLYYNLRHEVFVQGGNASVIGFFSAMLKSFGFFEPMCIQPVTELERNKFLLRFHNLYKSNKLSEKDKDIISIASFFLMVIVQEYRDLRENYLVKMEEEQEFDRIELERNTNYELEELRLDKARLQQQLKTVKEEKKESTEKLKKEVMELEKKNKRLQLELDKKSENDNELIALREYVFAEKFEKQPDVTSEDMIEAIKEKKLTIIGGHDNWVNKMKEVFPDYVYLSVDEKGRSFDMLKRENQKIVFNTATNSHSIYKKLIKNMNPTNQLMYLNGNFNIDKTIEMIYDRFK